MKPWHQLPPLRVQVDGGDLSPDLASALTSLRVRQELACPAQAELVFLAAAGQDLAATPQVGEALSVRLRDGSAPLFEGDVTAVELRYGGDGELQIRVRGYDRLHRLRLRQPVRAHVEMTVAALAEELVKDLGLEVEAKDAGPLRRHLLQVQQNDWQCLVEQAALAGLYPILRGRKLHLLSLEGDGTPVPLQLGVNLLEARFEVNGAASCRSVEVSAWDPTTVEPHRAMALEPRSGRRVGASAPPARFGFTGERTLCGRTADTDRAAEAMAQAELDHLRAAEVVLWGLAEGDVGLRPGAAVEVEGADRSFSGRHVLAAVEHRFDRAAGFVSEISSHPPPPIAASRHASQAVWGTVTRVDDPRGLGRVRVQLAAHGELESDWLEVVCIAAGEGKGLMALPDVDDRVLVLLLDGDVARGIVLGGLHGPRPASDSGVEGKSIERFVFRTSSGEQLSLDRRRGVTRLENGAGSFVEMGPEGMRLASKTDLTIEAPGKAVTIRGQTIDFERR